MCGNLQNLRQESDSGLSKVVNKTRGADIPSEERQQRQFLHQPLRQTFGIPEYLH